MSKWPTSKRKDAAIVGASGYTGGELLRLLLSHPYIRIVAATSETYAGNPISAVHRNLFERTDLMFENADIPALSKKADVIFFALPHGQAMRALAGIDLAGTLAVDLSADFRLKSSVDFEEAYHTPHAMPGLLRKAVYGLTEWKRKQIADAEFIANPGCFPTGALLALLPIAKAGILTDTVIIDSKTGSSGSGARPSDGAHHPERAHDFSAYNVFSHRHGWEIRQELASAGSDAHIVFTTHSAPMVRGIFTTCYVTLRRALKQEALVALYRDAYPRGGFVRIVESPHVASVALSNYCDIGLYVSGKNVIVTSAIDNLVKGAAGQAVQNMNVMLGFDEKTGLEHMGSHP